MKMKAVLKGISLVCLVAAGLSVAVGKSAVASELFVISASQATLMADDVGVYHVMLDQPSVGFFTDRPMRRAGDVSIAMFLARWSQGPDSFAKDSPNAALTAGFTAHKAENQHAQYIELSAPTYDSKSDVLTFTATSLEPSVPLAAGHYPRPVLFIDNFQMPCRASHQSGNCL